MVLLCKLFLDNFDKRGSMSRPRIGALDKQESWVNGLVMTFLMGQWQATSLVL